MRRHRVVPLGAKLIINLVVRISLFLEVIDQIEDSPHLEELCTGIDIQENTIMEQLHLAGVPGPHDEFLISELPFFMGIEEFGKTTDLLKISIVEVSLDDFGDVVINLDGILLNKAGSLVIEGKMSFGSDYDIAFKPIHVNCKSLLVAI